MLGEEGESGRFEFKETAEAVDARVLVAAANATILDHVSERYVTILVGVREVADEHSGVVRGEIVGLTQMNDATARRKSLEKARQKIQSRASETKPVPVGLRIIEEGVDTATPFLRLVVYPTRGPHYTSDGLRVTRYGASTRAITDEELADMYLVREAEAFRQRFGEIAAGLERSVKSLQASVDSTSAAIIEAMEEVESSAGLAASEVSDAVSSLQGLEMDLRDRPTSEEIIEWLEQGDENVREAIDWHAARLGRQINAKKRPPRKLRHRARARVVSISVWRSGQNAES